MSDIIVDVKVKPGSKINSLMFSGGVLCVQIKERPVKNKANLALLKYLKGVFGKEVEIISGFSSRNKKIVIRGLTRSEYESIIKNILIIKPEHLQRKAGCSASLP
jgi:uncharacterized protein (TIGR00251 family)